MYEKLIRYPIKYKNQAAYRLIFQNRFFSKRHISPSPIVNTAATYFLKFLNWEYGVVWGPEDDCHDIRPLRATVRELQPAAFSEGHAADRFVWLITLE